MKLLPFLAMLVTLSPAWAEVSVPSLFTDHMVLQRDRAVPIWGTASAGEQVTVEFAGQILTTRADAAGRWQVALAPMTAKAEPQVLKIGPRRIQDVLIGEVWLASGQSNMEWEMQMKPDSQADLPQANVPGLRLFEVPKATALSAQNDVKAAWAVCTPTSAASFSAIGYYFGRRLHEELKVPVGMLLSAWGGTRIEPWTSLAGFEAVPALQNIAADTQAKLPGSRPYQAAHERHLDAVATWSQAVREALKQNQPVPLMPPQPATLQAEAGTPTALYNAMIHPLAPYALRGALWYQGESNHHDGFAYTDKTQALLAAWRGAFQQPTLPFYFVQIAPFQYGNEDADILPQFWQAQRQCLRLPHTGMAVIADLGEIADIHPSQKKEVARRLSQWALAKEYGRREIDPSGPLYARHAIEGPRIRVTFDHAESGLVSRDGKPLRHFEIAGHDGLFHPAEATVEGASVLLSSPQVPEPRRARFAWSKLALPNLMDQDGLPAAAFHTHWPVDPDQGDNLALNMPYQSSHENQYGWDTGLTDGSWSSYSPNCYATDESDSFPKHVTLDLQQPRRLNLVRFGVPEFGSTRTVAVSLSLDGQTFREVGRQVFSQGKAARAAIPFADGEARYLRLTYLDHHAEMSGGFTNTFAFTSELEAYFSRQ